MPSGTSIRPGDATNDPSIVRALIVDDDVSCRDILRKLISKIGECDTAGDGLAAVGSVTTAQIEQRPYDLITLDISMPRMDGLQALHAIRGIEHQLAPDRRSKILMTSCSTSHKHITESYQHACEDYLIKPFSIEKLFAKLAELGFERPNAEAA